MTELAGARRAILAVVGVLWLSAVAVPVVAVANEPSPLWQALGAAGLVLLTATFGATLYAVATPTIPSRQRRLFTIGFAVAAALSIVLVAPVGADDRYTWAWIGGATAGFVPLLLDGVGRWIVAGAVVATAVLVGALTGGEPLVHGVIALSIAGTITVAVVLPFWLWDLLVSARAGREAQALLAVSEERLRFARDVHDLLGHRLAVIALKAELASRLASTDPERAAREAAEAQHLAATALGEVREAVHGYSEVDLDDQLTAVEGVLRDAGVRCTVERSDVSLSTEAATQLALALREGCTNVLRHSTAGWCTISLSTDDAEVRMTVANDGAASAAADRLSFGLRGIAERLATVGGTLRTDRTGDVFTLAITVPTAS
ncbi:sensor histidine kinase [Tenggerimyces flavus]|uniref:Sensor histidine kinase n=1 Tax=Tenggerimyces flavus TaxID=1708749 RepID=A0ABV7Y7B9_9ACTN|nr:histidine kinase [Tenggerimyces flavus]MBM7785616.1 two-component system sensor histidine kinase DesK [Tenggerimyces flavus]